MRLVDADNIINGLAGAIPYFIDDDITSAYVEGLNRAKIEIDDAPTVGRWIPTSERLPEKFGRCLVTYIPGGGTLWTTVIIARYSDLMGIAKPCFYLGNPGRNDFEDISSGVTAWMPLPDIYKGE